MTSTTAFQAMQALEVARKTYARFGYDEGVEKRLIDILTLVPAEEPLYRRDKPAERFRNLLWDTFSGGGVSASVTRQIFESLGRGDETDENWI